MISISFDIKAPAASTQFPTPSWFPWSSLKRENSLISQLIEILEAALLPGIEAP